VKATEFYFGAVGAEQGEIGREARRFKNPGNERRVRRVDRGALRKQGEHQYE